MSSNLLEYLMNILTENQAHISVCDYFDVDENDFQNYTITAPLQEKENIEIINSEEYLQNLSSENTHTFIHTCNLWNKLIDTSILNNFSFNLEKHYSDEFATFDLFKTPHKIAISNQILIGNTILNEYYKERCFNYNDLEKIDFLEKLIEYFKNQNKQLAIKNTSIKLLNILYNLRLVLDDHYTDIYDLEKQQKYINSKFNNLRKLLDSNYYEYRSEYIEIIKKYIKLLSDANFRKKYYFLYPQNPTKFKPFLLPHEIDYGYKLKYEKETSK